MPISAETSRALNKELERLRKERQQLDQVIKGLEQTITAGGGTRKRATRKQNAGTKRARKPGKRQKQALRIIKDTPGITPPQLAEKMNVKGPAVYPVLRSLKENGQVQKDGKGYKLA